MKKRVGDPYETATICGSYRKYPDIIGSARELFLENGFTVLAPGDVSGIINPGEDFVLFESDASTNPGEIEGEFQKKTLNSDVVYICNPEGYIGASTMMELGRLVGKAEIFFMEEPQEPVIRVMAEGSVLSPEEIVSRMKVYNDTFGSRDWPDADIPQESNFKF